MATIADKATLKVSSPAFDPDGHIPAKYTCDGYNVSPPLAIGEIPKDTVSMVLIVEDPDAPGGIAGRLRGRRHLDPPGSHHLGQGREARRAAGKGRRRRLRHRATRR